MKIGKFVKANNLTIDTVRHYINMTLIILKNMEDNITLMIDVKVIWKIYYYLKEWDFY